jgi:hypothetical protein
MQIADLRQNPTAHASLHYPANLSNMLEKGITENKYIIRIQAVITSTQSAATHHNYSLHRAEENKILRCCSKNSRTTTNYTYRGYDFLLRCSRKKARSAGLRIQPVEDRNMKSKIAGTKVA